MRREECGLVEQLSVRETVGRGVGGLISKSMSELLLSSVLFPYRLDAECRDFPHHRSRRTAKHSSGAAFHTTCTIPPY